MHPKQPQVNFWLSSALLNIQLTVCKKELKNALLLVKCSTPGDKDLTVFPIKHPVVRNVYVKISRLILGGE